jgi:hypothetical protein
MAVANFKVISRHLLGNISGMTEGMLTEIRNTGALPLEPCFFRLRNTCKIHFFKRINKKHVGKLKSSCH